MRVRCSFYLKTTCRGVHAFNGKVKLPISKRINSDLPINGTLEGHVFHQTCNLNTIVNISASSDDLVYDSCVEEDRVVEASYDWVDLNYSEKFH